MNKKFKFLGFVLMALLLVVGVGAYQASAALTLGALAVTSDGVLTLTASTTSVATLGGLTTGTLHSAIQFAPTPSATIASITRHQLVAIGDVTGNCGGVYTTCTNGGFGDPAVPTYGLMASFGRTAATTSWASGVDTGLDVRMMNGKTNVGNYAMQGAYIKAKNSSDGTVYSMKGLDLEVDQSGTASNSATGMTLRSTGNAITTGLALTGPMATALNLSSVTGITAPLILAGSSGSELTTATADTKFVQLYTKSTATTGTTRGIYNRLEISGAAGGESLRSYTELNTAVDTAHGAHITLGMGESTTAGSVTGLGVGVRSQLILPNIAMPANGTYAALQPEIWSSGSSSTPAAVTALSFIRAVNGGDGTGMAAVDAKANLLSLQGFGTGTGKMIAVGTGMGTVTGTIRIMIGSTAAYIPYYSSPGQ